jgi:hypothetical protein
MIKDEFNRLMALFHEGAEGKKINLHELFAEALAFFEHLKQEIKHGTPEERKEALQMMAAMHNEIKEESKKIIKTSGLSEEQLLTFAENPSNFTPEQWKDFQESKTQIHQAGMELVNEVKQVMQRSVQQEHKQHSVQEIKEPEGKKPKKPGKGGKTGWMRT